MYLSLDFADLFTWMREELLQTCISMLPEIPRRALTDPDPLFPHYAKLSKEELLIQRLRFGKKLTG